MHTIDIKRGNNVIVTIKPDDDSIQYKKVMAENEVRLNFVLSYYANFSIGDYAVIFGETYKVNVLPVVDKQARFRYVYTMSMQAVYYDLNKVQYFFLGADNTLKEPDFSLMGNADTFIDLMLSNLSRISNLWKKGEVLPTVYKNLTFSANSCYQALGQLAQEFDTEFWVEGYTIHLVKRQYQTGWTFKHGKQKGLYEIIRQLADQSNIVTRVYAFGSDKNLPEDYRDFSKRLLLPDPQVYLQKNVDKYGIIEVTQIFEDIFPHRTGTVTSVDAGNPFHFNDISMDFDINAQLLPGTSAKVTFNTGQLAGYTFEISKYDNSIKQFTLLKNKNENAIDVPSISLRPAIGDKYVLVDIKMPDTYITAAENELEEAAQKFLDMYSEPVYTYQLKFDPVNLKDARRVPVIGQVVQLVDYELPVNKQIRIVTATRNIVNEYDIEIEVSDVLTTGIISQIQNSVSSTSSSLNDLASNVNTSTLFNNNKCIGDFKIEQGTLIGKDITSPPSGATLLQLYIDTATGKVYAQ